MVLLDAFLGQMAEAIEIPKSKIQISNYKKDWALTGAKGRAPNVIRSLFLGEGVLEKHNLKLQKKYKKIRDNEQLFEIENRNNSEIVFVAYGISYRIAKEASLLLQEKGLKVALFRPITPWPFPYQALKSLAKDKRAVFVFELSYGQMVEDVRLALGESLPVYFYGRAGGEVFTEKELLNFVEKENA